MFALVELWMEIRLGDYTGTQRLDLLFLMYFGIEISKRGVLGIKKNDGLKSIFCLGFIMQNTEKL